METPSNWVQLVAHQGYSVSDDGWVRNDRTGLVLKNVRVSEAQKQYHAVSLPTPNGQKMKRVHTLMLETFVSPRPDGMLGLHANDNQLDNRLSNLFWGTPKKNSLMTVDRRKDQKLMSWDRGPLIIDRERGMTYKELGEKYGVSQGRACDIVKGRFATETRSGKGVEQ